MKVNNDVLRKWSWVGRYLAVIALALGLAAILGHTTLFQRTTLGHRLSAANLVEFLGFGVALAMLWLLGLQATITLQKQGGKFQVLQHLILPVVSLAVVALAYSVALLVLKPFIGLMARKVINWIFILAILACSGWLVMAVFNKSSRLTALLTRKRK